MHHCYEQQLWSLLRFWSINMTHHGLSESRASGPDSLSLWSLQGVGRKPDRWSQCNLHACKGWVDPTYHTLTFKLLLQTKTARHSHGVNAGNLKHATQNYHLPRIFGGNETPPSMRLDRSRLEQQEVAEGWNDHTFIPNCLCILVQLQSLIGIQIGALYYLIYSHFLIISTEATGSNNKEHCDLWFIYYYTISIHIHIYTIFIYILKVYIYTFNLMVVSNRLLFF